MFFNNKSQYLILEAKSYNTSLQQVLHQVGTYAFNSNIQYAIITNGARWLLIDPFLRTKNPNQKIILDIDIFKDSDHVNALKLWLLSKLNLLSSNPFFFASQAGQSQIPSPLTHTSASQKISPTPSGGTSKWYNINDLLKVPTNKMKPYNLKLPNGTIVPTKTWTAVFLEAVKWLVNNGKLTPQHCPVPDTAGKSRYCIHTSPVHPNGKSFTSVKKAGPLFAEVHYSSANLLRNIKVVYQHVNVSYAPIKIRI